MEFNQAFTSSEKNMLFYIWNVIYTLQSPKKKRQIWNTITLNRIKVKKSNLKRDYTTLKKQKQKTTHFQGFCFRAGFAVVI